jgi:hypothetical protein
VLRCAHATICSVAPGAFGQQCARPGVATLGPVSQSSSVRHAVVKVQIAKVDFTSWLNALGWTCVVVTSGRVLGLGVAVAQRWLRMLRLVVYAE